MHKKIMLVAAAAFAIGLGSTSAFADDCSGRDHTSGTILGAIAGGLLGSAASHGNGGAVVGGALLGGLAGNAISSDMDCSDRPYAALVGLARHACSRLSRDEQAAFLGGNALRLWPSLA